MWCFIITQNHLIWTHNQTISDIVDMLWLLLLFLILWLSCWIVLWFSAFLSISELQQIFQEPTVVPLSLFRKKFFVALCSYSSNRPLNQSEIFMSFTDLVWLIEPGLTVWYSSLYATSRNTEARATVSPVSSAAADDYPAVDQAAVQDMHPCPSAVSTQTRHKHDSTES